MCLLIWGHERSRYIYKLRPSLLLLLFSYFYLYPIDTAFVPIQTLAGKSAVLVIPNLSNRSLASIEVSL